MTLGARLRGRGRATARRSVPGAPLALQVTALMVGSLVAAQAVTLALTLLLPPKPAPEYRLADIAAALKGGALAAAPRPLVRAMRPDPPSLQSAGWLVSERSRDDLARMVGAAPQDVRLLFFSPPPFAGAGAMAALAPHPRLYVAAFALTEGPGGGPPGAFGGGSPPGAPGGLGGGFAERARGGAGAGPGRTPGGRGGLPGGARGGFAPGRGSTPADAGVISRYGSGRTAAGGGAPVAADLGTRKAPDFAAREPTTGVGALPFSPQAAAAARALGGPAPLAPAPATTGVRGLAAPPAALLRSDPLDLGRFGVGEVRTPPPVAPPPAQRDAAPFPTVSRPIRAAAARPVAAPDLSRPTAPVLDAPAAPLEALTPAQALATVRAQATRAAADRGGYILPAAGGEARGLFGLAPAPFVQGDFVAALRVAPSRWVTVQPRPEPFPNAWQRRVLLWFALAFAVAAPLGLVFARRLARPLGQFAEAAERLGKDPASQHLELEGPAELGRAARAFNRMQGRLKRYIDDRTAMVGAISHDLRTPLARMRFRLERAPPEVRAPVLADIAQMEEMISSVLVFIRDASEPAVRERVDLRSILECVVDGAAEVGGEAVLDPGEPVPVDVDSLSVQRVVTNLVENALKYGERAHVRMYAENGEAVAEVQDDGPGLPAEEMERVFLPFYRSEQARTLDSRGIGLGLAVSRSIARAHGGDVRLLSRGDGLVAQLRLPLAAKAA